MTLSQEAIADLRVLVETGWYVPGESYPVLSVAADSWINRVRELAPALLDAAERVVKLEEALRALSDHIGPKDMRVYASDPPVRAARALLAQHQQNSGERSDG